MKLITQTTLENFLFQLCHKAKSLSQIFDKLCIIGIIRRSFFFTFIHSWCPQHSNCTFTMDFKCNDTSELCNFEFQKYFIITHKTWHIITIHIKNIFILMETVNLWWTYNEKHTLGLYNRFALGSEIPWDSHTWHTVHLKTISVWSRLPLYSST